MKRAAWFIVSELLLLAAIALAFSKWQGNVNFALGLPLSECTLNITGAAHGGTVVLAFATLVVAFLSFVAGLIRLGARDKPLPSPPPPIEPERRI